MGKNIVLIILLASLGFNVFLLIKLNTTNPMDVSVQEFKAAEQKYPLLAKRILQEFPQDILINFYSLRKDLQAYADPFDDAFGLYFEYLPTGTSISINSNNEFYAASLFKVPVIMAYYHGKERLGITEDPIIEVKQEHIDKEFGSLWEKGPGTKLNASEAVKLSLQDSDNTAIKALLPYIEEQDFNAVYDALDIDLRTEKEGALVSARAYASILKALHFSSLLSKESSQEILDMLAHTKFPDKLQAGVPDSILVAHKIGNFRSAEEEGFRDCGIVYVPRRPYMLCMFSVGDEQTARDRMQEVSRRIYDYVSTADR